jgi:hypothetical protein
MSSMNYTELIGHHVTITYRKYRKTTEYSGIIREVTGIHLLLEQDQGERIWLEKLRKNDHMVMDDKEVLK